ncbi:hypothetical protein GGX14DRAFT_400821 [Mycena pura]|uniref:Uncharacterized protein n=1 Tax=Mycena pura TaxID=153505 RepID=A0AAD6Y5D3_9AGAR|nr:hypothetical protein GGX14DRAFT_400821 [Mycena pura]
MDRWQALVARWETDRSAAGTVAHIVNIVLHPRLPGTRKIRLLSLAHLTTTRVYTTVDPYPHPTQSLGSLLDYNSKTVYFRTPRSNTKSFLPPRAHAPISKTPHTALPGLKNRQQARPEPLPEAPLRAAATLKQSDMAAAKDEQIHKVSVQNKNLAKKAAKAKGRGHSALHAICTPSRAQREGCRRIPCGADLDIPRTAPRRRIGHRHDVRGHRHDVRVQRHHALTMIVVAKGSSLGAVVHPLMLNNKLRSRLGFDSAHRLCTRVRHGARQRTATARVCAHVRSRSSLVVSDEEQEQDNDAQHSSSYLLGALYPVLVDRSLNHDRYGTHLEDLSAWAELVPEASQLLLTNLYTGLRTETGAPAIRVTTTSRFPDDKHRAMEKMQHAGEAAAAN